MRRACAILMACAVLTGCVAASPRFSPEIQKSFRDHEMRRLETENLKVYYPEHRHEEALRVAGQLEACLEEIEGLQPRPTDWGLIPVFMPEMEFNNAYVTFGPGQNPHVLLPTHFTANIFGGFGFTPSAAAVGCHELVHYLHLTQIHGVYGTLNQVFGPSLNPHIGLDAWFMEGLATYFESRLVEGVGRYGNPLWENMMASGIADEHLDGGRLSAYDRAIPPGGHYLVGSYFVGYLAERYGEEKLWQFVDRQGSSIVFPLGVSLRFMKVYKKSLGTLIDEFVAEMRREFPPRMREQRQQRERWVGRSAAFETGPGGRWALYSRDVDALGVIEVFDAQGRRLLRRQVPDVLPGRQLVGGGVFEAFRFSPDGQYLYFLAYHQGLSQPRTSLMRLEIATNRLRVLRDEVHGVGGDVLPSGEGYILAVAEGRQVAFRAVDLRDGADRKGGGDRELFTLPPGAYVGWVRVSPDGERLAFTLMEEEEWSVAVVELSTGEPIGRWTTGQGQQPVFDARWIDEDRLVFVASDQGGVQIMEGSLQEAGVRRRSHVPYMAYSPAQTADGGLRFLNREGWGWSLDRLPPAPGVVSDRVRFISAQRGATEVMIEGYQALQRPATVVDDRPYSSFEGLFIPRLRIPFVDYDLEQFSAGLELSGRDEMGFHNWAIRASWEFGYQRLSGSVAYVNMQLAPWVLAAQVSENWTNIVERIDAETLEVASRAQQDRVASVQVQRRFLDIPVGLIFQGVDFYREAFEGEAERRRRLVGTGLSTGYAAGRQSAYGGTQWLLGLSGDLGYFPQEFGSDFSLGDVRSQLEIHTPLPFSGRHRLRISGRIRALTGVPEGDQLLRVGGFTSMTPLYHSSQPEMEPWSEDLAPPRFIFVEPLRGYEDFGLSGNRAAVVDINYRYPLIVDRGAASVAMVLPSFFFQGIDLEGFASGATMLDGDYHAAVGVSADLKFMIWVLPVRFRYQLAQRLVDDEQLVHSVGLGFGQ